MLYTVSEWGVTPTQLNEIYNPPKVDPNKAGVNKTKTTTGGAAKIQTATTAPKPKPVLTFHSELAPKVPKKDENKAHSNCQVRDWLVKNIDTLPEEGLSYLVLASKNLGDDASAQKAYKQLIKLSSTDASMMNWNASTYDYRFTSVESTALGLRAVLAMEPGNSERIEGIKQWLLLQRTKDGWENTKTTAEVFMALLIEEIQHKAQTPTEYQVKVVQEGQDLFNLAYDSTNMYGAEQKVKYHLSSKPSTFDLSKSGPGRLYWSTLVTYFRKLLPGDQTAGKGAPEGLSITRKYFRLVPRKEPAADGSIHFKSEEIVDHQIKAGETILMKTFVNSPIPLPYVKIESALPSGAEVVKADSREASTDNTSDKENVFGDWGYRWWTHEDDLDDKVVYFGTRIPQGLSTFHTMMRMELPGKMEVLPTTLEGMYSDKIRGYSPLEELTVKE
jgi:uncharacterized protein YfaS (alpha-2-macroglobulin family)